MSRAVLLAVLAAWIGLGGALVAHHSVGINFDNTKAFDLTGVLKESTSGIHTPRSRSR